MPLEDHSKQVGPEGFVEEMSISIDDAEEESDVASGLGLEAALAEFAESASEEYSDGFDFRGAEGALLAQLGPAEPWKVRADELEAADRAAILALCAAQSEPSTELTASSEREEVPNIEDRVWAAAQGAAPQPVELAPPRPIELSRLGVPVGVIAPRTRAARAPESSASGSSAGAEASADMEIAAHVFDTTSGRKGETAEERKERKRAVRLYRRQRRAEREKTRRIFKDEELKQTREQMARAQNPQGFKID
eukprot:gnl/Chilomastix_cuspidata/78.p4 GENE.gnl/Chilomastix_cuspidata/78~~gnl/Chilomastix_cuspidata/78.p4  ORF type:complete len:251 (-),score=138.07 gnl/Chilomastix_cuspidata/78:842-1594(-)